MSNFSTPVKVVGALTTILLLIVVNPWFQIPDDQAQLRDILTWAFWISFIVLLVLLFMERNRPGGETIDVEGPAFARFLFSNTKAGLFWLPVRLFLGFSWLDAGWHKFTDPDNAWLGGGAALAGYWERAAAIPAEGRPPITYEWYRSFIQLLLDNGAESWFAYLIVFGEIAVGIGLIVGCLTGFAAFFGALMNMSFLLAGSASTNPVLFTLAIGVILAWKVAGYYGVDRWLLPILGTPWHPAVLSGRETRPAAG
jgi:thiosulfate dehydrogenase [quinone] large subunit